MTAERIPRKDNKQNIAAMGLKNKTEIEFIFLGGTTKFSGKKWTAVFKNNPIIKSNTPETAKKLIGATNTINSFIRSSRVSMIKNFVTAVTATKGKDKSKYKG